MVQEVLFKKKVIINLMNFYFQCKMRNKDLVTQNKKNINYRLYEISQKKEKEYILYENSETFQNKKTKSLCLMDGKIYQGETMTQNEIKQNFYSIYKIYMYVN